MGWCSQLVRFQSQPQRTPNTCCPRQATAAPRAEGSIGNGWRGRNGIPGNSASVGWEQAARGYRAPLPAPLPGGSGQDASGPGRNPSVAAPNEADSRFRAVVVDLIGTTGHPLPTAAAETNPTLASPCSPGRVACVKLPSPGQQDRPLHKGE